MTAAGTGTLIDEVERLLEKAVTAKSRYVRLADRAATLICGDTVAHSKPHPAPLLEAAGADSVPDLGEPAQLLVAADERPDRRSAEHADHTDPDDDEEAAIHPRKIAFARLSESAMETELLRLIRKPGTKISTS